MKALRKSHLGLFKERPCKLPTLKIHTEYFSHTLNFLDYSMYFLKSSSRKQNTLLELWKHPSPQPQMLLSWMLAWGSTKRTEDRKSYNERRSISLVLGRIELILTGSIHSTGCEAVRPFLLSSWMDYMYTMHISSLTETAHHMTLLQKNAAFG